MAQISFSLRPFSPFNMYTDTDEEDMSEASFGFDARSGVASSHTSHDASMRSASPVPSVMSVSSSFRAQAYKHEYGRGLNNYSEVYRLPADEEELSRLGAPRHPHGRVGT